MHPQSTPTQEETWDRQAEEDKGPNCGANTASPRGALLVLPGRNVHGGPSLPLSLPHQPCSLTQS